MLLYVYTNFQSVSSFPIKLTRFGIIYKAHLKDSVKCYLQFAILQVLNASLLHLYMESDTGYHGNLFTNLSFLS